MRACCMLRSSLYRPTSVIGRCVPRPRKNAAATIARAASAIPALAMLPRRRTRLSSRAAATRHPFSSDPRPNGTRNANGAGGGQTGGRITSEWAHGQAITIEVAIAVMGGWGRCCQSPYRCRQAFVLVAQN
jgi:hypothetical protein